MWNPEFAALDSLQYVKTEGGIDCSNLLDIYHACVRYPLSNPFSSGDSIRLSRYLRLGHKLPRLRSVRLNHCTTTRTNRARCTWSSGYFQDILELHNEDLQNAVGGPPMLLRPTRLDVCSGGLNLGYSVGMAGEPYHASVSGQYPSSTGVHEGRVGTVDISA